MRSGTFTDRLESCPSLMMSQRDWVRVSLPVWQCQHVAEVDCDARHNATVSLNHIKCCNSKGAACEFNLVSRRKSRTQPWGVSVEDRTFLLRWVTNLEVSCYGGNHRRLTSILPSPQIRNDVTMTWQFSSTFAHLLCTRCVWYHKYKRCRKISSSPGEVTLSFKLATANHTAALIPCFLLPIPSPYLILNISQYW